MRIRFIFLGGILSLLSGLFIACGSGVPEPSEADEAAIYAAAIRQLYTVDHTFGHDDIRRFPAVMRAPIDIHADGHTMETLYRVYKHIFDKQHNINKSFVDFFHSFQQALIEIGYFFVKIKVVVYHLPGIGTISTPVFNSFGFVDVIQYR